MANGQIISNIQSSLRRNRNQLLEDGLAITYTHSQTKSMGKGNVYVGTTSGGFSVYGDMEWATIWDFRTLVDRSDYYLILNDGSLIQTSFVVGNSIRQQRLAFLPCPFEFEPASLLENGLLELLDNSISQATPSEIRLVPRLRFEFDSTVGGTHPVGHLHIGSAECRIPTKSIVNIERFLSFVITHYYSSDHGELSTRLLEASNREDTVIRHPQESRLMYLNWRTTT